MHFTADPGYVSNVFVSTATKHDDYLVSQQATRFQRRDLVALVRNAQKMLQRWVGRAPNWRCARPIAGASGENPNLSQKKTMCCNINYRLDAFICTQTTYKNKETVPRGSNTH